MIERTFSRPTPKKILALNGIEAPQRIPPGLYNELITGGILVNAGETFKEIVSNIENSEQGRIYYLPEKFRIPLTEANRIKSLEKIVKIDSATALKDVTGESRVPSRLSKAFLESHKILPYMLIEAAVKFSEIEDPPMGYYWVSRNGRANIATFERNTVGREMKEMKDQGDFEGRVLNRTFYGNNLDVEVNSRDEGGKEYTFSLLRLPVFRRNDSEIYSAWTEIDHRSADPDSKFRGEMHNRRVTPPTLWSATAVFGFYLAGDFSRGDSQGKRVMVNPFGIPRGSEDVRFTDDLRLKTLIRNEDGTFDVLNKSEISRIIGARSVLMGYGKCWTHWGSKDFNFLYTPQI